MLSALFTIVFMFCLYKFMYQKSINHKNEKIVQEYPIIDKDFSLNIAGVVLKKIFDNSSYSRGIYLIELSDSIKFALYGGTRNYLYNVNDLSFFLQINDSINKSIQNDSIFVYRNKKEYYFILGEMINKKD